MLKRCTLSEKYGVSIGVLAADLGVAPTTLRKWESRYGFPLAQRSSAGVRLYTPAIVDQLRLALIRMAGGEKPGVVLRTPFTQKITTAPFANDTLAQVLLWLRQGQPERCEAWLGEQLMQLGAVAFADDVLGPLLLAVGEGWLQQRVRVLEEHSLSTVVQRVLVGSTSYVPLPLLHAPQGPTVLLATLSGEHHTLGLSMVESVLRSQGAKVVSLGASVPLAELTAAVQLFDAQVLALSLSPALAPRLVQCELTLLMQQLPPDVCLWLGGGGVAALRSVPAKTRVFTSCSDIASALATVSAQLSGH